MVYTLQNKYLTACINSIGAELISLKTDGLERIWQAEPTIWPEHAPLLFPVVGRLLDKTYTLNDKTYHIDLHGFGRKREFEAKQLSDTHVVFCLTEDEASLAEYPFAFSLEIDFLLDGRTLTKRHTITNRSQTEMPFEIGGHDGYCTTLLPGETMSDYAVEFKGISELAPYEMDADGILDLPARSLALNNGLLEKLPADENLDTFIFDAPPVRVVSLVSRKSSRRVTVSFDDFDYLGIWTSLVCKDTNYLCIEPMTALPDGYFVGRDLTEKKGIRILASGETQTLSYQVTFE